MQAFFFALHLFEQSIRRMIDQQILSLPEGLAIQEEAEALIADREFTVTSVPVLTFADSSPCSAYDCEFVILAKQFSVKLVTQDKKSCVNFLVLRYRWMTS